ncbi:TA system antitoxin ParD family protein [Allohahella marinimesophila]|uniref:ParD-like antitoxin of type II toxin-antitoxin system n=1 Tax=Allohahella marinimesophila TaxID=1054972 RepID=A0ABP7NFI4_9GAMM
MAKYSSPVRLQASLMQDAALTSVQEHRSTAQQIEYWASIGRTLCDRVNPEMLASLVSGMATLKVEQIGDVDVDPEDVFASLEADRESGALASAISELAPVRYQAAAGHPGLLERIDAEGVTLGRFVNGEFQVQRVS